jgi:hypothetical protein
MKIQPAKLALTLIGAAILTLGGCGGGGGASTPGTSTVITGTAAAGLPMVGTVTVKDANGATRTVTIGTNGAYTVDVSGMTGPFVFRAEGSAGGTSYVLHSGATAADVNGNINITPLTDLIIANIAGQLASNYFEGGDFAGLTTTEIAAETDALKTKLLPVLTAMGVESSIDLLRAQFTPLSSALDKALDVISVSIDPVTNQATITNLVNEISITDDIATKAAAEPATTPLAATDTTPSASDDVNAVKTAIQDFAQLFANGLPTAATIEAALHGGTGSANAADATALPFRDRDLNAAQLAAELASDGQLVGLKITDVEIHRIDYTSTDIQADVFPRAFVSFTMRDPDGAAMDRVRSIQFAKGSDGRWRLRGDGRRLDVEGHAHMVYNAAEACRSTGLEFTIEDIFPNNNGGTPAYALVTGPGLPNGGLKYVPNLATGHWVINNVANQNGHRYYILASDCFDGAGAAGLSDEAIAAIPDKAAYQVTFYRADDQVAVAGPTGNQSPISYKEVIARRPMTLGETQTAGFPSITAPTSSALAAFTGGSLTVTASGMGANSYAWVFAGLGDGSTDSMAESTHKVGISGGFSTTFTLDAVPTATWREVRIEGYDAGTQRRLMTQLYLQAAN